jgi:ribosomal protein L40E
MSETKFSNNYGDLCDGSGFQFEFYCEHCHDAWRTEFKRYGAATASGILDTASSLLGGIFGGAGRVVDHARDAGYRTAKDTAFAEAIEQAKTHFHRCRRCANYFCAQCFNPNLNLCVGCAPSVEEEANVAARQKEIEMASAAAQAAVERGQRETDKNVVCDACGARVKPSKFCSECGAKLEKKHLCGECGAELKPDAKFCSECGAKQ